MKLGAASFISGEVDGMGKQQLTGDDLQQLVGATLLSSSLPLFSSSFSLSPFSSLSRLCSS